MDLPVNKIICGDCLSVMKDWPDNCVDLVLTDPPYGIGITGNTKSVGVAKHAGRKATNDTWDNQPIDINRILETMRISKHQIIFGANYFWECFYSSQCYLVWDKRGDMPDVPFCDTEFAWTSFTKKPSKRYIVVNHGFVRDSKEWRSGHPTQKPLRLFAQIVQDFSQPSDLILDPFCGSGTTCVAAKVLGRNYIGIDISEKYCQIARQRIRAVETGVPVKEQNAGQMPLFAEQK